MWCQKTIHHTTSGQGATRVGYGKAIVAAIHQPSMNLCSKQLCLPGNGQTIRLLGMRVLMKQMIRCAVCVWFLIVWGAQCIPVAEAQSSSENVTTLRIGSMELLPYGWKDAQGKNHGLVYEMNQEIGIRSGIPFTNKILPFTRMLVMLKNGKLDLLSSQAHQAALDAGDKLAMQFTINVIAGTRKGSGIRTIEDFKGKYLVYHHSASYPQLEGLPREILRVKDYRQSVQLLHMRPIVDGAVFSEPAYYYWMQDLGLTPDDFGDVIIIEPDKEQWIFVRKGLPQSTRDILKRVVEEMYQEHRYEQMLTKYGKK